MNAEYACFTETDGKIHFIRGSENVDESLVEIGYFVRLRLDLAEGSLVIPIPETIEGKPVTMIGIIPELPDDRPVPELPSPLIRRISIPSGVRHIRIGTSITRNSKVPKGTRSEKFNPMNGCMVEISPDNRHFCVFGQGIYSADMTKLCRIFSTGGIFSVPYGVRRIKSAAGCAVKGLKKLVIPESVTEIGNCAFEGCTDLEEADICAEDIGLRAFYGCKSLTSISLEGIKTFYEDSFEGCSGLGEILKKAFDVCYILRKFKCRIDKSIGCFDLSLDCSKIIQPIGNKRSDPDKHNILGSSPFLKNNNLRKLTLSNIECVGYGAFAECLALKTLVIENTASIGMFAFISCHKLFTAYLDCKEIYDSALNSCTSLEKVTLVNTEIIHGGAFSHCEALKEIELPNTLRSIGEYAFYKTSIQRLTIPPNVKEIGHEILGGGILEIVSASNTLASPSEDILCAGTPGVTLMISSAETNEVLYELDLSYIFTEIFSGSGIDPEAYDSSRSRFLGYNGALLSARSSLRRFPNTEGSVFDPLKRYVSDLSALNILEMIEDDNTEQLWKYPYYDDIDNKRFLNLIDHSARQGAIEITALLMQKLNERQSRERSDPF